MAYMQRNYRKVQFKMAALVGGHTYGLSSHDKNSKSKTLIFVKLTDSALKSIEEYVKGKANSALKPTIQFKANNGVIRLSSGDSHVKSYYFNLSSVETDGPQGSFECQQERGSRSLESLGSMHVRMNINANEDSYEKTRVKMAAVEKENKKFCTKEIKPSGSYIGRKVKLKPSLSSIPPKTSSPLYITPPSKSSSKLFTNSVPASANQLSSSINSSRQINSINRIAKHTSAVQSQSCRNRIIHLLAVRPYSTSELIIKLTKEGIKEAEKKCITAILSQVAVLKENHSYILTNEAWDEVQVDWKFYTQEEVELARTKKLWNLKSRTENRVSSPTNIPHSSSPNQKRALSEWEINNTDQRNKKQRISHLSRQSNNTPNNAANSSRTDNSTNNEKFPTNSYSIKRDINGHSQNSYSMKRKEMNGHVKNSYGAKKETNGHVQICETNPASLSQKYSSHLDITFGVNGIHGQGKQEVYEDEKLHVQKAPNQKSMSESSFQNGEHQKQPNWLSTSYKNNKVSDPIQKYPLSSSITEKTKESHRISPVEKIAKKVEYHDSEHYGKVNDVTMQKSYHNDLDSNSLHATNTKKNMVPNNKYSNGNDNNVCVNSNTGNHNNVCVNSNTGSHNICVNSNTGNHNNVCVNSNTGNHQYSNSITSVHNFKYEVEDDKPISWSEQQFYTDPKEYYREYPPITSKEQRARYKEDFNSDYEEYKILHDQMKRIANRFAELEDKLKRSQLKDDALDYMRTQRAIIDEYTDPSCFDSRKKLNFLHGKLSHIKRLVMEYDRSQVTAS